MRQRSPARQTDRQIDTHLKGPVLVEIVDGSDASSVTVGIVDMLDVVRVVAGIARHHSLTGEDEWQVRHKPVLRWVLLSPQQFSKATMTVWVFKTVSPFNTLESLLIHHQNHNITLKT